MNIIREYIEEGDFTLKSGKKSSYYINLRPIISSPIHIKAFSRLLFYNINNVKTVKVCGLPYSGIPYACAISLLYNLPMLMLRKEPKKHGTAKMIEGKYEKGDEVVLIDDILTTGASVKEALKHLNPEVKIQKLIVIVDREEGGKEELEKMGIKVERLYTISDIKASDMSDRKIRPSSN